MSKLSAQCDELRAMAESVGMEIPKAATLLMEAADTIDRLDAENAKLREELESVGTAAYLYGRSDLKTENAKLRELVSDMYRTLDGMKDQSYSFHDVFCADVCPRFEKECVKLHADECWYEQRMRELGVEVEP